MQPISTLIDDFGVRVITSSTDATPIVVTATAHGLVTGDTGTISGHTTNTNANGFWTFTKVTANTFSLDDSTGTGAGAGGNDGYFCKNVGPCLVEDYDTAVFTVDSDGGGDTTATVKFVSSNQQDEPDFAAPQASDNQYDYVQVVDLEDGSEIDGDTGFTITASDDHRQFEANTNGLRWLGILPTSGAATGELTVTLKRFNNN